MDHSNRTKLYSDVFENLLEGIQIISPDYTYFYVNPTVCIHGKKTKEELLGKKMSDVYVGIDQTDFFVKLKKCMVERCSVTLNNEFTYPDGKKGWFQLSLQPIDDGVLIMSIDITEQIILEKQLLQSQKLEAIGRLAGGIAHDFNNLLSAITGYCELIRMQLHTEDPLYKKIEQISKCGERASALTRQLLAFSRQQVFQLKVLNMNDIVLDIENMLRRLIGENIAFRTALSEKLGIIKADPSQMEQIILNLVINARDAMPNGGHLTLETSNIWLDEGYAQMHFSVTPGEYIMIAVTDTGSGMDEATKAHIFEPFFTTKEQGKGTGLGLATIYGIVKQSSGNIWCYSELGKGTTFKVYLPLYSHDTIPVHSTKPVSKFKQGQETILVTEDEESVREIACEFLRLTGYKVLSAANGGEALMLCQNYKDTIHLLLTDVIMPGISGKQLAQTLSQLRPNLKVLYTSGYTDNSIVHHGILDDGIPFLQKPYNMESLNQKVRDILDSDFT